MPAEEISSETIVSETKDTNEVKEVSLNQIQDTEMQEFRPREEKRVEKQSHSTQTNSVEKGEKIVYPRSEIPFKESHSTQTSPEQTFSSNKLDTRIQQENEKNESNKSVPDLLLSSMAKSEQPPKQNWKAQQNKYKEYCNSSPKKYQEESPRKIYQKRTNFSEERKLKVESTEKADRKIESSPLKISYAMKAMAGLENIDKNPKVVNEVSSALNNKIPNGLKNAQTNLVNGTCQVLTTNGVNRTNYPKHVSSDRYNSYEEKKNFNGNVKNGFAKTRYNKSSYGNKTANDRNNLKDLKIKDRKIQLKSFETPSEKSPEIKEKCEEVANESTSQSEKSSTVSELSSPTELSSGQNTPPEKLIVRKMEQKIANEINKSFEEKLKQNLTKNEETLTKEEKQIEEPLEKSPDGNKGKKNQESKKKNKGKTGTAETTKETLKPNKKKKKKVAEESKAKEEASDGREEIEFLPNFIIQEPKDLIFGSWSGMKDEQVEMISKMDTVPGGEEEILKTLGIKEDQIGFSKLPLHSDLLMMLPVFGWSRPKFKIEDIFAPTKQLHNDLFTRRNITSMKSTKPEEFFASVVDNPVLEKSEKKKDPNKNGKKDQAKGGSETSSEKNHASKNQCSGSSSSGQKKNGNVTKAINKTSKNSAKSKAIKEEPNEKKMETNTETDTRTENEVKENKFGIVDAVNTWLKEQGDTGKVLSVDSLPVQTLETLTKLENEEIKECKVEENYDKSDQKNVTSNPMHALYGSEEEERVTIADFRGVNECIRVANVINDGFIHIDEELYPRKKNLKKNRMQRSSSLDGKFSEPSIKKHLKFLTDSALFCQDLISDVRNGLPTKNEYATEELCDPKQSVLKYYILSPSQQTAKVKSVQESDSENEAFDALEYKFLTKENVAVKEESDEKCVDRNGNVSVTDSGVHSDMDSSEDMANDPHKDVSCKLQ